MFKNSMNFVSTSFVVKGGGSTKSLVGHKEHYSHVFLHTGYGKDLDDKQWIIC